MSGSRIRIRGTAWTWRLGDLEVRRSSARLSWRHTATEDAEPGATARRAAELVDPARPRRVTSWTGLGVSAAAVLLGEPDVVVALLQLITLAATIVESRLGS